MSQVSEAMKVCSNDTERASLENLKCDLQEILDLTRETLNELQGPSNTNEELNDEEDPYAQEMAIFMAELNECRSSTSKATDNSKNQTPNEVSVDTNIHIFHESLFIQCDYYFFFFNLFRMKSIPLLGKNVRHRIHLHGEQKAITMHLFAVLKPT